MYPTAHEPSHTLPFATLQSLRSYCWPKEKRALRQDWNFLVSVFHAARSTRSDTSDQKRVGFVDEISNKKFPKYTKRDLNASSFYLSMNRTKTQLKKSKDSPHTDVPSRQYFKTSHLRWLKAVSSTLQDVGDVSLLPLIINWCCNHGIKKLPNQAPMNTLVSFSWHSRLPWQQYDLLKTHLILALNTYI